MDLQRDRWRRELARAARRRQVLEALEFEREREAALREQLEETLAEAHGAELDEAVYGALDPDQAQVVREVLEGPRAEEEEDPEILLEREAFADAEPEESLEEEVARLETALAECRSRQQAFERYLELLNPSE